MFSIVTVSNVVWLERSSVVEVRPFLFSQGGFFWAFHKLQQEIITVITCVVSCGRLLLWGVWRIARMTLH